MPHYVGLDASKATTSICIVNEEGERVQEGVVETDPRAIVSFLRGDHRHYRRIGIEALALTPLIFEALAKAGLPIICIENRHTHNVLKNKLNKTDRNDARGIAEIMRAGIYKAVHVKTRASQEARLLLTARKLLVQKRSDIENLIGAFLLQEGRKLSRGNSPTFVRRVRALVGTTGIHREVIEALLAVRENLSAAIGGLETKLACIAAADPVCQRLATAPGVGPLTALMFRTAIDVPGRFSRSRNVGAHLGMTPAARDSGTKKRSGRISRCGDSPVRAGLHLSAGVILRSSTRSTALKAWGERVVKKCGYWKARVAVARKLAVILHRMWVTETEFSAQQ
jgi:transposase